MKRTKIFLAFAMLLALAGTAWAQQTYVWWEGEDYASTNSSDPLARVPGHLNAEQRSKLSGGQWMTPRDPDGGGAVTITYEIEVPESKTYNFWVRKFWKHGPFKWRFDNQDWQTCGRRITLHDNTFIAENWGANWVSLGQVELSAGEHTLHVEMIENNGCFDAWLLIDGSFSPRGKLKPGQKTGDAMPGFFAWEPSVDPLMDNCPIDMSFLNTPITGFVRKEGNGFVDAQGNPVRFWMVQGSALLAMDKQSKDYWARRLSKYGVNLVRVQFSGLFSAYTSGNMKSFNEQLDDLHYLTAALKKQGIYLYFGHLYWQTHVTVNEKVAGPGYEGGKTPLEHLFFSEDFQAYYKKFVDAALNKENPYTGVPLSKDPAVAFVEIQNESSLFFWTFKPDSMVPQTLHMMEKAFGDWSAKKYGDLDKALATWGNDKNPANYSKKTQDAPAEGRLAVYGIGQLTGADWAANQRNTQRASDQLQFMVEWQVDFYDKMVKALKEDVGLQNMVSCSNWKTADPKTLGIFERYSYTAGDVTCRNVYFDVQYDPKPKRFYSIDEGDTFMSRSALMPPAQPAPLTVAHVLDHPYMITENNWCRPNRFRAEWPFLIATYAQMMGVDGWNFFSLDAAMWQTPMNVWELNSPCILGQFPAAALVFRKGYVKEAGYAVEDKISWEDLYDFKGSTLFELGGADALWVSRIGDKEAQADATNKQVEPMAFFVGKVNRIPTDDATELKTVDFKKYINPSAKKVRSMTDELEWDYGKGIVTVSTPYVQGAAGFLSKSGKIQLADMEIQCGNEYATVLAVSLDGQPLRSSKKILVQVATEDLPYGFTTKSAGQYSQITSLGGYPLNVKEVDMELTLKRNVDKATVLDGNGYTTDRSAQTRKVSGSTVIQLPADSIYTLVE
ncbi:MAG: hypothetical protein ACLFUS_15290 [Candidatus Sumerlaeia bacterium]